MKNKIMSVALALLMALSFTACGEKDDSSTTDNKSSSVATSDKGFSFAESADWKDDSASNSSVACLYRYNGNSTNAYAKLTASVNVVEIPIGNSKLSDIVDMLKAQYTTLTQDYKVSDPVSTTFLNYEAAEINIEISDAEVSMALKQIVFIDNGTAYAISYGAEKTAFTDLAAEFKAFIETFKVG